MNKWQTSDSKEYDECAAGVHNCPDNSHCKNNPGSFDCVCNDGYYEEDAVCKKDTHSFLSSQISPSPS